MKVKKTSTSTSKLKTIKPDTSGRDEKINPDTFYLYKDENERLKKHQIKLNDEVKR